MSVASRLEEQGAVFEVHDTSNFDMKKVVIKLGNYRDFDYVNVEFNSIEKAKIGLAQDYINKMNLSQHREFHTT